MKAGEGQVYLPEQIVTFPYWCYPTSVIVQVRLKELLAEEQVPPARLVRALHGEVARASVYALLKPEQVRRVDLKTLSNVLVALRSLTGRDVQIAELLVERPGDPTENPALTKLLQHAQPADWHALQAASDFSDHERQQDETYWRILRAERNEELRRERKRYEF